MKINTVSAIAAATLALSATQAAAQEPRTTQVSYADLDVTTQAGQDKLNERLDRAIGRVCYDPSARSTQQFRATRECRKELRGELDYVVAQLARGKAQFAGVIAIQGLS